MVINGENDTFPVLEWQHYPFLMAESQPTPPPPCTPWAPGALGPLPVLLGADGHLLTGSCQCLWVCSTAAGGGLGQEKYKWMWGSWIFFVVLPLGPSCFFLLLPVLVQPRAGLSVPVCPCDCMSKHTWLTSHGCMVLVMKNICPLGSDTCLEGSKLMSQSHKENGLCLHHLGWSCSAFHKKARPDSCCHH